MDAQKDAVNVILGGIVALPAYVGAGFRALLSASDKRCSLGAKDEDAASKALNVEGVEAMEEVDVRVNEERKRAGALPLRVGVA